ncbi:MAG TPA: alpha/beta hydrolase [Sphingobacteriaceae bacterium]|nr:alpha/beta hydrolase [Sphingobacteriaceae bacterium]
MKKLKEIISQFKTFPTKSSAELNEVLLQLICYSPKMPLRLHQEQLLSEGEQFSLKVNDEYFSQKELLLNGFKWGGGTQKILITHGWGSKAADFTEIIYALKEIKNVHIIAFDAPGNGSSEGELSNLLLYIQAIKAIVFNYGKPDILIGHSLGAMANIIALNEMLITPSLLISLTPLIRLKENFETSMHAVDIPQSDQDKFLKKFEDKFGMSASYFNLSDRYTFDSNLKHWLAYDQNDQTSPLSHLKDFLNTRPFIKSKNYDGVGHVKILKNPEVITDIVNLVSDTLCAKRA